MTQEFLSAVSAGAQRLFEALIRRAPDFDTREQAFSFVCRALQQMGLEPSRVSLAFLPTTTALDGHQLVWRMAAPDALERVFVPAGFAALPQHLASPLHTVMTTCEPLAVSKHETERVSTYPFLTKLFGDGATDYAAVPMRTRRGAVHVLSVATRMDEGWPRPITDSLEKIGQALTLIVELFEVHDLFSERELMLRELNHRVKNNLAMAGSLLRLQAHDFSDPAVATAFSQSATRVESVAMVHEQLYARDRLTDVDLGAYARDLVTNLMGTQGHDLRTSFDVEVIFAKIEHAVTIALILNELVTNALKHGTSTEPDPASPWDLRVSVRLSERGVHMAVGNRVGGSTTPGRGVRPASFGQQMIEAFGRRLNADITFGPASDELYWVNIDFGIREFLPGASGRGDH